MESLQLTVPGAPSLLLSDVAEYSTLAFLAAFEYDEPPLPGMTPDKKRPSKKVTYIALSKKTMPMLVSLYGRFKDEKDVYSDGTLERVFAVHRLIPLGKKDRSLYPLTGILHPDEAQVRCTGSIKVWVRSTTVEDSYY